MVVLTKQSHQLVGQCKHQVWDVILVVYLEAHWWIGVYSGGGSGGGPGN